VGSELGKTPFDGAGRAARCWLARWLPRTHMLDIFGYFAPVASGSAVIRPACFSGMTCQRRSLGKRQVRLRGNQIGYDGRSRRAALSSTACLRGLWWQNSTTIQRFAIGRGNATRLGSVRLPGRAAAPRRARTQPSLRDANITTTMATRTSKRTAVYGISVLP
jgi:hypothetical protein